MRTSLHVLMTADAVGGVWTYALDLAGGLGRAGVRVTLAVSGPPPSDSQRRAARAAGAALVEIEAPLDWTAPDETALREAAVRLAGVVDAVEPDVLHLNAPALAAYAPFRVPVLGVCHSCLATWWAAIKGDTPPPDFRWRIDATAAGYAACDALVAPSHAFAAATARAYGASVPTVIHNGRQAPPLPNERLEPLVLTAGRLWDEGKDATTLDRAAKRLDVPFVALGPLRAPGGGTVRFDFLDTPGVLDLAEVRIWMSRASIFVSAALYEPFGLAVLEAAQAGAALVLADIPTFRELWDGAAVFVRLGDAEGFAEAIRSLLASAERLTAASLAAHLRAERFGVAPMVEGYLARYRQLVSSRDARPASHVRVPA